MGLTLFCFRLLLFLLLFVYVTSGASALARTFTEDFFLPGQNEDPIPPPPRNDKT